LPAAYGISPDQASNAGGFLTIGPPGKGTANYFSILALRTP